MKMFLLSLIAVFAVACGGTSVESDPVSEETVSRLADDGQDYTVNEAELASNPALGGEKCGPTTCKVGSVCCDKLCGKCVPLKGNVVCTQGCGGGVGI